MEEAEDRLRFEDPSIPGGEWAGRRGRLFRPWGGDGRTMHRRPEKDIAQVICIGWTHRTKLTGGDLPWHCRLMLIVQGPRQLLITSLAGNPSPAVSVSPTPFGPTAWDGSAAVPLPPGAPTSTTDRPGPDTRSVEPTPSFPSNPDPNPGNPPHCTSPPPRDATQMPHNGVAAILPVVRSDRSCGTLPDLQRVRQELEDKMLQVGHDVRAL